VSVVGEDAPIYGSKLAKIPITDMAAAAGVGIYNDGPLDSVDYMHLPPRLIKPNHTYLTVRVKGVSMAPTLQDGGYVVIRLLDKSEWATMHDQRVFVVIDTDGKAYLKRVKNRFKQGFIVLRSDSPDQATYPSFNLETKEIAMIWYVELYFSAKMPNIHDQFYTKLQLLEDRLDEMQGKLPKINYK
jgi:phage repressor protein C with HTH and peptisase S24 domain